MSWGMARCGAHHTQNKRSVKNLGVQQWGTISKARRLGSAVVVGTTAHKEEQPGWGKRVACKVHRPELAGEGSRCGHRIRRERPAGKVT